MMRHRLTAAAAIVPLVLAAGCTSSKKPTTTSSSSRQGTVNSGAALALNRSMKTALSKLTSTAIDIEGGGLIAATTGHITLANGAATASDLTIGTGADASHVITVGSDAYAALPKGQNTSGKPYIKVSATSGNEFVRALDSILQILQAASSLGDLVDLLQTATNFTVKPHTTLGGAPVADYTFNVIGDANGSTLQKQLAQLGTAPVPVELYVNGQNLPVKIVLTIAIGGTPLPITATLSNFNGAVTITAPSANQVASG